MEYIQIGVTALRGPSGEFLPSVPLYVAAKDAARAIPEGGGTAGVLEALAERFGEYMRQREGVS